MIPTGHVSAALHLITDISMSVSYLLYVLLGYYRFRAITKTMSGSYCLLLDFFVVVTSVCIYLDLLLFYILDFRCKFNTPQTAKINYLHCDLLYWDNSYWRAMTTAALLYAPAVDFIIAVIVLRKILNIKKFAYSFTQDILSYSKILQA